MKALSFWLAILVFSSAPVASKTNVPYKEIADLAFAQPDAELSYGSDPLQFGKLWIPESNSDKPPLVIFIHGGCWLNAFNIDHSLPLTAAISASGAIVWSLEYRRTGDSGGGWPGTFEDVLKGSKFALEQSDWGFDPTKVFLVGHSAGGHLALLINDVLLSKTSNDIKVIGLAAITDVIRYSQGVNSCQSATPKFMGGSFDDNKKSYQDANPKTYHNVVLIHGTEDNIVPIQQSTNTRSKVKTIEGGGHFDFLHPQSDAFSVLMSVINEESK